MTKDEYTKNLYNMVMDVNTAEIAAQIESDNLRMWCHRWSSEMLNRIAMVHLIDFEKEKKKNDKV